MSATLPTEPEAALEPSERRELEALRALMNETNLAVYLAQDEKICNPNPATLRMYGYPEEILTGHPFTRFIHADDRDLVRERHLGRLRGEDLPSTYEFRIINALG